MLFKVFQKHGSSLVLTSVCALRMVSGILSPPFHSVTALRVTLECDSFAFFNPDLPVEVLQMLPRSLSSRRDSLKALSSRLGMPPFLGNGRLSSTGCSASPPSEGHKLNTIQFTACPQVWSGRGEAEPEASHSMGANQCGCAGLPQLWGWPRGFVFTLSWGSYCRNAGLARCAGHNIPSPPEVTGYQLPLPALGAAWCGLPAAWKALCAPWEWPPAHQC